MSVTIYSNNNLAIDDNVVGNIKALTSGGAEQSATGAKGQDRSVVYLTSGQRVELDIPAYVDGKPNPALAEHFASPA